MSLTVKIDTRSKAAKKLVDYLETLSFVKIDDAPHYDPAFVKKIQMAEEEEGELMKSPSELWESIK